MSYKPNFKIIYPCFQLNFEKHWYDYFSISLFYPYFEKGPFREDMDVEESIIYAFNAPTTANVVKSRIHIGFKIQLLGFGIGVLRQNGY
jgi:hypothetical protein|tara:strand:+ start:6131 stop:6397 length:267 start_codon:yes stop_codon:yes gene_type:complete